MRGLRGLALAGLLAVPSAFAAELLLSVGGTFNHLNLFGQSTIPTYRGAGGYAEFDYLIPVGNSKALSLFGVYHKSTMDNLANDAQQTEVLDTNYVGGGVKLWAQKTFFSASIGKYNFKDTARGTNVADIRSEEQAYEVGVGHRFKLSQHFGLIVSLHALHATLHPENGSGFTSKYGIWQYRAGFALNFVLPSSPSGESN